MKKALISTALLLLAAAPGHAGYVSPDSAYCSKSGDGTGMCYGTIRGFKHSVNAGDYAVFWLHYLGGVQFSASFNGVFYGCVMPSTVPSANVALFATQTNGSFMVRWNASGVCTYADAYAGSLYG